MTDETTTLLSVRGLSKRFPVSNDIRGRPSRWLWAVDFVDLDVGRGRTLGLVGESGSGKSTLARLIVRLTEASSGSVRFDRLDVLAATGPELRRFRRQAQLVFQDPYSSLDPRKAVEEIVAEGLTPPVDRGARSREVLDFVGLPKSILSRRPHELSGGERQRVSIARALAVNPRMLILDEPVSALDLSAQGRILNLLADLQAQLQLTYLFIAHDLSVVRHVADDIAVMYRGHVVEMAPADELMTNPLHPYSQVLVSAAEPANQRAIGPGVVSRNESSTLVDPPASCRFAPVCFRAIGRCHSEVPPLARAIGSEGEHRLACFNYAPIGSPDLVADATADLAAATASANGGPSSEAVGSRRTARPLLVYAARSLGTSLLILLAASMLIFTAIQSSGGQGPIFTGYVTFVGHLLSGNLGTNGGYPISTLLASSGIATLELGSAALLLVYGVGIPLGVLAALRRGSLVDAAVRLPVFVGAGIPNFVLATLLIKVFVDDNRWLPFGGSGGVRYLVLPALVLALEPMASTVRLTRAAVLDEVSKDYVRTLRAGGMRTSRVVRSHVMRNALAPVVAHAGTTIPLLFSYTVIVEYVFAYPGLGYQLFESIVNREQLLAETLAVLFAGAVILSHWSADVAALFLNPRARERVTLGKTERPAT